LSIVHYSTGSTSHVSGAIASGAYIFLQGAEKSGSGAVLTKIFRFDHICKTSFTRVSWTGRKPFTRTKPLIPCRKDNPSRLRLIRRGHSQCTPPRYPASICHILYSDISVRPALLIINHDLDAVDEFKRSASIVVASIVVLNRSGPTIVGSDPPDR
jgi:hypothetical protein